MKTPLEVNPSDYHTTFQLDRSQVFSPESYLSKSSVYELYASSLYKWRYFPRQYASSPAMTWGSMVDAILTCSPAEFDAQFISSPYESFRTKEARIWREEQQDEGRTVITPEMHANANAAATVLKCKHKYAAGMLEKSKTQVVLMNQVTHPSVDRSVNVKGLVDLAPEGEPFLCDLKTTADFGAGGFEKTIAKFGYHVQAGLYLHLWNAQFPDDQRDRFQIIWQDSSAPYEVAVTEIPQTDIADGMDMFSHLLGRIVRAADKDWWPMKYPKPVILGRAMFGHHADEMEMDGLTEI